MKKDINTLLISIISHINTYLLTNIKYILPYFTMILPIFNKIFIDRHSLLPTLTLTLTLPTLSLILIIDFDHKYILKK